MGSFANETLKPVTLQLKWKHQFQFAGYYAAKAQGFYRDAGFDVTLKESGVDTNPITEVLKGRADYGIANSELALYRLQGQPLTALAVVFQHSPIVLMTLADAGILSPQDLIGKRVMYPQGHYGANTLGILLKEGVSPEQVVSVPLSFDINDLIEGKVDAMVAYITDQPHALNVRGIDYRLMDPRTYGIDFYGDTLFTTSDRVMESSSEADLFREASLAGWRYAVNHPEEIIDLILTQYQSSKTREELQFEANETIKLIVPDLVEIGHMNPGRWLHIADTFKDLGMASGEISVDEFLYQPDKIKNEEALARTFRVAAVVFIIVIFGFAALIYFNSRLRALVEDKTQDLKTKNEALLHSQSRLIEKEAALSSLNTELEQRVEERTRSLDLLNKSLIDEISDRKEKELSLELLHQAIANSKSAVMILDRELNTLYISRAMYTLTGLDPADIGHKTIDALSPYIELPELFDGQISAITDFRLFSEVRLRSRNNSERWCQVAVSPMSMESEGHGISHYVIVCEDISDLKMSKDKLEQMALYDSLTGLENRTLFAARLDKVIQLASRTQAKSALLFIDIDHFKGINDNYGHEAGDQVLQCAAERLSRSVRENDTVARISGDEFTVILSNIHSYNDAGKVAENIIRAFSAPIKIQHREIFATVSIGLSIIPDDASSADQHIRNADMAMYQAKQTGRNNYQFFSVDMNEEIQHRHVVDSEMRKALISGDFFLLFQPKISLQTGQLVGVEALIRWRLSDGSIRLPGDFIPLAEETGLIISLGHVVMEKAIEAYSWLKANGFGHIKVAMNVSPRQVREPGFVADIESRFEHCNGDLRQFELEITESAFIGEDEEGIARLNKLRDLGFSISVDDFGTGYSSLSYLQRLPIDTLKIDRTFVAALPDNTRSAEISRTIIAMAKNLSLSVVAEGIENEAQAQFFRDSQCDIAQGYLYGKPMSLKSLALAFSEQNTG